MSENQYGVNQTQQPQQPRRRRYQGPAADSSVEYTTAPRTEQMNPPPVQPASFAQPQRSYQVNDIPAQPVNLPQSQRHYQVDDAPVQQAVLTRKPRNYRVADDADIRRAGFTDTTLEERQLIEKINNCSDKNLIACMLLCLVHCHYFYVGRKGRGLLCLLTCNFLFVGMIIDLVIMACGQFKDAKGRIVHPAARLKAEMDLQNFYRQRA